MDIKNDEPNAEDVPPSPSPPSAGAVAPDVLFADDARAAGEPPPSTEVARVGLGARNLPQKTFVSLLQEIATENGRQCSFELLASEGRVHEPTFVYRAVLTNYAHVGEGAGKNKKVAKHMAAKRLLERMFVDETENWQIPGAETLPRTEVLSYLHGLMPELGGVPAAIADAQAAASGDTSLPIVPPVGPAGANPIQSLHEMITRRKWPAANYKDGVDQGVPHERIFEIECHVGRFMEAGRGKSKKQAKREAAEKMLFFLRDIPLEIEQELMPAINSVPENPDDEEMRVETSKSNGEEGRSSGGQRKERKTGPDDGQKLSERLEIIRGRNFASETPSEEHLCLLEEIVSQLKWEKPVFEPLEHRGMVLEEHFGILEIPPLGNTKLDKNSILPITVHGIGPTKEAAHHHSAMNALHALAVCFREQNGDCEPLKK